MNFVAFERCSWIRTTATTKCVLMTPPLPTLAAFVVIFLSILKSRLRVWLHVNDQDLDISVSGDVLRHPDVASAIVVSRSAANLIEVSH